MASVEELSLATRKIFREDHRDLSYADLYTKVYVLVIGRKGREIYNRLTDDLEGIARELRASLDPQEIHVAYQVVEHWKRYVKGLDLLKSVYLYLDKHFVEEDQQLNVADQGLVIFHRVVVQDESVWRALSHFVSQLVAEYRARAEAGSGSASGGPGLGLGLAAALLGPLQTLRELTLMLADLSIVLEQQRIRLGGGGEQETAADGSGGLPYGRMEQRYLSETQAYVSALAQRLLSGSDVLSYIGAYERVRALELELALHGWDPSTAPKVDSLLLQHLVVGPLEPLLTLPGAGLASLLQARDLDALRTAFRFSQLLGGAGTIVYGKALREHLLQQGRESLGRLLPSSPDYAESFVRALVAQHDEAMRLVQECCLANKEVENYALVAFEDLMSAHPRAPELVALYMNRALYQQPVAASNADGAALAAALRVFVQAVRLLREKDAFEQHYKQLLARRLLGPRPLPEDLELRVARELRRDVGTQFTSRLQGMFADVRSSMELTAQFRNSHPSPHAQTHAKALWNANSNASGNFSFSVHVLTGHYWPVSPAVVHSLRLPEAFAARAQEFAAFYQSRFPNRQLAFHPELGMAVLVAVGLGKPYELTVSTYQAMILLRLSQSSPPVAVDTLMRATGIPEADFRRALDPLLFARGSPVLVARRAPNGVVSHARDLRPSDSLEINAAFRSPALKVVVGLSSASAGAQAPSVEGASAAASSAFAGASTGASARPDAPMVDEKLAEERKNLVDCAVVRLLKRRRRMVQADLLVEVVSAVSSRFVPSQSLLLRRLDYLIEREFISRSTERNQVFFSYVD